MEPANGRKRIVISGVSPSLYEGRYPARGVIHQPLTISADIFCDGHDRITAQLMIRHADQKKWKKLAMRALHNDRWELTVIPDRTGTYEFYIEAWVDHFSTWRSDLKKKHEAGQDIHVDLATGLQRIEASGAQLKVKEKPALSGFIARMQSTTDMNELLSILDDPELEELMWQARDPKLVTAYKDVLKVVVESERAGFSTWYEVFPRSCSREPGRHGTFNDVKSVLPHIAKMGFDVLYFPPIHPIGKVNRKGRNNSLMAGQTDPGSPWAIGNETGGHKAIHEELGTLRDFKSLVTEARKLGISVALDIAFQCAPDHPYVKSHPQWFRWKSDGTVQHAENPPKKYEDILPFHFECEDWKALWAELKSVIDYWIAKGVTIFRVDNPHTKPFAFWEWLISEVHATHPDVIFLAEAFTRPKLMERLAMAGFTQSYTYFTWRSTKRDIEEYVKELTQTDMRHYFRPNFWPNTPDILTEELVRGGENIHIIRLVLAATLSSNYGMYGPVYELLVNNPMEGKEEYGDNEKYEIRHWDWDGYTRMREIITMVNRARKENRCLQNTFNIRFADTTDEHIICYAKADAESNSRMIVAVNLDPHNTHAANVRVPVDHLGLRHDQAYKVTDVLSGEEYRWQGEWNFVQLNPYEMPAHIFQVEPFTD